MANSNTLKEDIAILVEELSATEITSNTDFIIALIDKWSSALANYLSTVIIIPADAMLVYEEERDETQEDEDPLPEVTNMTPNVAALKSAISAGLIGIGIPTPTGFITFFLNGLDAGHTILVAQAATSGVTAIPPLLLGLRSATESALTALLSVPPADNDIRYGEIATAIDTYTKLGTWTLPNGVTGIWS